LKASTLGSWAFEVKCIEIINISNNSVFCFVDKETTALGHFLRGDTLGGEGLDDSCSLIDIDLFLASFSIGDFGLIGG